MDDHPVFREGLKMLLKRPDSINFVAEANNGNNFLELIRTMNVGIVFMYINMPVLDGIKTTEQALELKPDLKIIALTTFSDNELFNKMIYAGVEGYMLKNYDWRKLFPGRTVIKSF